MKQADLIDIFKKASKSDRTLTIVVFPDHLSPAPSTSLAMEIPENIQETLTTLNQQIKEISIWNTSLMNCTAQVKGQ
jgi:hypothetical protein